jgi:hypothetical protein
MEAPLPEVVDVFLSFLEAAIFTVLRARGVYPEALFERARAFGVVGPAPRAPPLADAVAAAVAALRPLAARGALEAVFLVLLEGRSGRAIEQ